MTVQELKQAPANVDRVVTREDWLARVLLLLVLAWLAIAVVMPLYQIVSRSLVDSDGAWVGFANYQSYFATPRLAASLTHSLFVAIASTVFSVGFAFIYAYGLTRTCMPGKRFFRLIALLPLYVPSLAHAVSLIYLFGNQGVVTTGFFGLLPRMPIGLYGPTGIILGESIYCFPQAVLILTTALLLADGRLYEATQALRTSAWRTFWTVTLPGIQFGLVSALFVCFTLVFTDFGVPKVVGGNYNVLATDIYRQVIGQQNFTMGATISVLMLIPTAIAFVIDRLVQQRQGSLVSARIVPYQPRPNARVDRSFLLLCSLMAAAVLAVLLTLAIASVIDVWPYNLNFSLRHWDLNRAAGGGYTAFWNSLRMSAYSAVVGTLIVFGSAYVIEKCKPWPRLRQLAYFASTLPVALPGLVLGLAYIFFFNPAVWRWGNVELANPFHGLYNTMALLVICNVVHFYTVSFLTATTALRQLDPEFEAVAASMGVPFFRTFYRVTTPLCLPALLQIGFYLFVMSMVTVSAVIFLYPSNLQLASVAVVNMDDAGNTASAAAMSTLIVGSSLMVQTLYSAATQKIRARTQAWLKR